MNQQRHAKTMRYTPSLCARATGAPLDAETLTDPALLYGNTLILSLPDGYVFRVFYQRTDPLIADNKISSVE
jgi:hypothetical protein